MSVSEAEQFWDEFAEEYTQIQSESRITFPRDLCNFLLRDGFLPTQTFVDVAGGSGKYVPYFSPYVEAYTLIDFSNEMLKIGKKRYPEARVHWVKQTQSLFLNETPKMSYEIVFTALNPALTSIEKLQGLLAIAKKALIVVKLSKNEDTLFSPFEKNEENSEVFEVLQFLKSDTDYWKQFQYTFSETIERSFFEEYFEELQEDDVFQQFIKEKFKVNETANNETTIIFDVFIFKKVQ